MIRLRIIDAGQLPNAVATAITVAGEMGATGHDFVIGPMDDKALLAEQVLWVDGADEVEAAEVLGSRLAYEGVAFDGLD